MVIIFFFFGYQKWWAYEAERLIPFLMKDIVLLAVSVYLLRQDVMRVSSAAKQKHEMSAVILSH
jgi:uncharacterized membrane protein YkgB